MTDTSCQRCTGSGEIGFSVVTGIESPGPVPLHSIVRYRHTCPDCQGTGTAPLPGEGGE